MLISIAHGHYQVQENSGRELQRTSDVKSRPTKIQKGLWPQLIMSCAPFRLLSQDFRMKERQRVPEVGFWKLEMRVRAVLGVEWVREDLSRKLIQFLN